MCLAFDVLLRRVAFHFVSVLASFVISVTRGVRIPLMFFFLIFLADK